MQSLGCGLGHGLSFILCRRVGYGCATVFFRTMTENTTGSNIIQIDVTDQICTPAVQYIRAQQVAVLCALWELRRDRCNSD